jgi:integrase
MPKKKLTDLFCEAVKAPAAGRVEYYDAAFGGLVLRVTANGRKTWSVHYRIGGTKRRFTIGNFPAIKPAQARRAAGEALDRVSSGVDPSQEKRARRSAAAPENDTFAAVAEDYLEQYAKKNIAAGTRKEMERLLRRDVLPNWRNRPIGSITRGDVNKLVDGIAARGAPVQANRTLAWLRALFNWAVGKDRLQASPVAGIKPPVKERPRDRALSDDEVRWLWTACDGIGWPFGPLTKLLVLTAQRRDEVAGMEWSEIDLDKKTWTMPREKAKNARANEVQLSDAAAEILRSLPPDRIGTVGLVFTTNGSTPVSGFSRAKAKLDGGMLRAYRQDDGTVRDEAIPPWILHDLRRTAATGMARLNVPPHVVDKVLNHVSGTIRGVAAVYNRFEYLEERRRALEAWGRYVSKLVDPVPANIIDLRGRGGRG